MKKTEYLEPNGAVDQFCGWLAKRLPELAFHLKFAASHAVPGGMDVRIKGIEAVLQRYYWNAKFEDQHGATIISNDWDSTRRSLHELGRWLRASVEAGDESGAATAAIAILKWGGVSSARPFIEKKRDERKFCAYLAELAPLFSLDGDVSTSQLTGENIERFDSGMTKVHAIYDTSGSPIYDSRVGAAMAMLWAIFSHETKLPQTPCFPSGPARGNQLRDPKELGLGLPSAPQFYTAAVPRHMWARWQLQTGWIIQSVLRRNPQLFASQTALDDRDALAARCHAFEASLFMIGYDLRCLNHAIDPEAVVVLEEAQLTETVEPVANIAVIRTGKLSNSVPTGHPFQSVMAQYLAYRQTERAEANNDAFLHWLNAHPGPENTPIAQNFTAYTYPLREREFDLHNLSLEQIRLAVAGGEEGLRVANGGELVFVRSDEREKVCLMCAGLTGCVYRCEANGAARQQRLIASGAAGTPAAAGTLMNVGRAVGRHFGLLDENSKPTALFDSFYGADFCADCFG